MVSLKTFLAILAPLIGTTPATLYERQRVLVRMGLLKPVPGRGPGSGVALTAESLATLLIAYAAADNLGDVEKRAPEVSGAESAFYISDDRLEPCQLTGEVRFGAALTKIIASPDLAFHVWSIEIELNGPGILIEFGTKRKRQHSLFTYGQEASVGGSSLKGIMKKAVIDGAGVLLPLSETLEALRMTEASGARIIELGNQPWRTVSRRSGKEEIS